MIIIFVIICFILTIEILVFLIVLSEKRFLPWLITKTNFYPKINEKALKKFFNYSHHPKLGWWRAPNSVGVEKGQTHEVMFNIDELGSRYNPNAVGPPKIASFGDSYAFCRQVNDKDTWQAVISKSKKINLQNFGVGNYGLDQSFLRFQMQELDDSVEHILVMFVPETVCRIQSYWKHYLEFGNTFAFKPIFKIQNDGTIGLKQNLMKKIDDVLNYKVKLKEIQFFDRFYLDKFHKSIIRFPLFLNLNGKFIYKMKLIYFATLHLAARLFSINREKSFSLIFEHVLNENFNLTYELYQEKSSQKLLRHLFDQFSTLAKKNNQKLLFIIAPQLLDLKNREFMGRLPYEHFFASLGDVYDIIDMTAEFHKGEYSELYTNDSYGGHFSVLGNNLAAKLIIKHIDKSK